MALASWLGSRTRPGIFTPPVPELMTVHDAAAHFSVVENMLANLVILAGTPVQSTDSWGNNLYKRTDIRELLGR
jgi:hypothetical protein